MSDFEVRNEIRALHDTVKRIETTLGAVLMAIERMQNPPLRLDARNDLVIPTDERIGSMSPIPVPSDPLIGKADTTVPKELDVSWNPVTDFSRPDDGS